MDPKDLSHENTSWTHWDTKSLNYDELWIKKLYEILVRKLYIRYFALINRTNGENLCFCLTPWIFYIVRVEWDKMTCAEEVSDANNGSTVHGHTPISHQKVKYWTEFKTSKLWYAYTFHIFTLRVARDQNAVNANLRIDSWASTYQIIPAWKLAKE